MDMSLSWLWEMVKDREAWHPAVHEAAVRHDLVTEHQPREHTQPLGDLPCSRRYCTASECPLCDATYKATNALWEIHFFHCLLSKRPEFAVR